jgi:DNA-directed RNA polymerase specialized sigma24 family protein
VPFTAFAVASKKDGSQKRQKRGGGKVRGESVFPGTADDERGGGIGNVMGAEPTPEFAALAEEECERLLGSIPADLREIALLKLEGYENTEIAEKQKVSPRTVERKLNRTRKLWEREFEEEKTQVQRKKPRG